MQLSNTAVPKYYGMFRDKVLSGEILVNEEISLEMNRIDALIANPGVYYNVDAVEGWIAFCEDELTLTDGSNVNMLDTFKLWGESIFGWYYYEDREVYVPGENGAPGGYEVKRILKRLIVKQYLVIPRGAAKSMYDSFIQSFFVVVNPETTYQVATAPTMKQAEEVMSPIRTALAKHRGPLLGFLTEGSLQNTTGSKADRVKVASTKKGIENFITGSVVEIRPMSINKLQGLRNKISTVDEWLSGDTREDVIGALEQGASKLDDYLIVASSSEGTVRNGTGDTIKMELLDILKGNYVNPRVSIWYYKLDSIDEVAHPETWIKANPNLGKTVSYETYHADVERAEKVPSVRNDILAKRFNIPLEGHTYFFTYEETIPHKKQNWDGMVCSLGIDMSQGDDFCSFTLIFPLSNGLFGVKSRNYISQRTFDVLPAAARFKYESFVEEDSLVVMPGVILDTNEIYDDLVYTWIESHNYEVLTVGYDPYNAAEFITRWTAEHGPFGINKVPQGVKTETVPLGELKKLAEDRMLIHDELIMMYAMGNCITLEDTNGGRKLYKLRREQKIDSFAALMDAYISFKANKDVYS